MCELFTLSVLVVHTTIRNYIPLFYSRSFNFVSNLHVCPLDSFRPGDKAGSIQKKSDVNECSSLKALSMDTLRPFVPEYVQTVTKDGQCIPSNFQVCV